jgi:hypothetical protein
MDDEGDVFMGFDQKKRCYINTTRGIFATSKILHLAIISLKLNFLRFWC